MTEAPTAFISYSWDSPHHRAWVRRLARALADKHIRVVLDEFDVPPGGSLTEFMEQAISASDFTILVGTQRYAEKANSREGGAGYEEQIITGRIVSGEPRSRFIPILRRGEFETGEDCGLPIAFAGVRAIDFRSDDDFVLGVDQLARAIHQVPAHGRPALGPPPAFLAERVHASLGPLANQVGEDESEQSEEDKSEGCDHNWSLRYRMGWGAQEIWDCFKCGDRRIETPMDTY